MWHINTSLNILINEYHIQTLHLPNEHMELKMDFRLFVLIFSSLIIVSGCQSTSTKIISKSSEIIELQEFDGIKKFKKGEYSEAFELLKTPATWGYKSSQYTIAFMFLKGHHVEQSTLLGMGWLGVATEEEVDEWSEQYKTLYDSTSPDMQKRIDKIVEEYIRRYGLKAQKITCTKTKTLTTRVKKHMCFRSPDTLTTIYDIDLVE